MKSKYILVPQIMLWLCMISGPASAQSQGDLERQYQSTCSADSLRRVPDLREQCAMIRSTLEQLKGQSTQGMAPAPAPIGDRLDARSECGCARKLGSCIGSAKIVGEQISKLTRGFSSKVIVRLSPPAGQCAEVTAYLQESASYSTGVQRTGHPLHAVIKGPTDVEWQNLAASATRLQYQILEADTQCYICDADKGGVSGMAKAVDTTMQDNEIRQAMETEYQNCQRGIGPLFQSIDAAMRQQVCNALRTQIDSAPR